MTSRYSIDQAYTGDHVNFFETENYLPSRILQKTQKDSIKEMSPFDQDFYIEKEHLLNQTEKDFFDNWYQGKQDIQRIYDLLCHVHEFESHIHKRFPGAKRFSIEGVDGLVPGIDTLISKAKNYMIHHIALAMTHRGRLSVLSAIFGKKNIVDEFENTYNDQAFLSGDVKYHKGYDFEKNGMRLTLLNNPSHLESIGPVLSGYCKATQALPVMIHGDGAFSGQGVVYEMLQMSQLPAYYIGGAVHFVLDNHVAFSTSPDESRSTRFCTDIAKAFEIPVLHVGADHIDKICSFCEMALLYRLTFKKDIIIRISGYRRFGHNELDDPSFTQPILYQKINTHDRVVNLYKKQHNLLENHPIIIDSKQKVFEKKEAPQLKTFTKHELKALLENHLKIPESFSLHPKLAKLHESFLNSDACTFALAEKLALLTLIASGNTFRFCGQDSIRGTFSQRHAIWYDQKTSKPHHPFGDQASFFNTFLSEYAAMGFEYGYGLVNQYVFWEAQFGDFANGGQIIIDQFLSSSFAKWGEKSALTLLLPHGMEGQGPEHSSARLERFLQLSADNNWIIANVTTPSNYYHLLRLKRSCPLIVMTPKSLLRKVTSCWQDLEKVWSPFYVDEKKSDSVIFCSGKIYYDLQEANIQSTLIRLEQLYPFPKECFSLINKKTFWVQEEPQNMGAWSYIKNYFDDIQYIGRKSSSSPATGYLYRHEVEQKKIIQDCLDRV
jgi:2-oxoglutarate dehydrogenase complex dehydrogenase (E1) component-like enzyme